MTIPEFILQYFLDQVLGFLAEKGRNLIGDAVTRRKIRDAINNASSRFENEYPNKELARVLNSNTRFHDLQSVRESIRYLLEHPFDPAPKIQIEAQFKSVVPVSCYDEIDTAAGFFLECFREELIGVEELHSILSLIYEKRTADATERTAIGIEKLLALHENSIDYKKSKDKKSSTHSAQILSSPISQSRSLRKDEVFQISKQTKRNKPKTFVYGRPVHPTEFFDREPELLTIFGRLRNGESTAIVGERRSGKTSLLLKIADTKTQKSFLNDSAKKIVHSFIDLQTVNSEYKPVTFWEEALEPLQVNPGHSSTAARVNYAKEQGYSRLALHRLFTHLADRGQALVLLLDEYDRFLSHPNFRDPSFFAILRSLSSITGGLVIVATSKLTIAQMNNKGKELFGASIETSPLFNTFIELKLRPFDDDTVQRLLKSVSSNPRDEFFITRIAGHYPFLLQAMAAIFWETPGAGETRQIQAAETFYQRAAFYFEILWREMDDKAKTAAVILSLMDLCRNSNITNSKLDRILKVDLLEIELMNLATSGLARKSRNGWTIDVQAFTWWIRDVVISRNHELKEHDEWLREKKYSWMFAEPQWDELIKSVNMSPEFLTKSIGSFVGSIVQELEGAK